MTAERGRRPGHGDTRSEIIDAARCVFAEVGYGVASIRAIARRAEVDPALVHHYFATKADLFIETMAMPIDPKQIEERAGTGGFSGERLVEHFLGQWERGRGPGSPAFVSLAQAMTSSAVVADNMREFILERVGVPGLPDDDEATKLLRRCLVSSQLLGIAWTRYVTRMEPVASASRSEVARWAGPTIDRYATGAFGD